MNCIIINPKRSSRDENVLSNTFNYHAGYSNTFVREILGSNNITEGSVILDPWNGMGTTTHVASSLGLDSIGIDYNPVMKVISLANHATITDVDKALKRVKFMRVEVMPRLFTQVSSDDLLLLWFDECTASYIRYIDSYIMGKTNLSLEEKLECMTPEEAVLYFALFGMIKELLSPFIGSNPTWIRQKGITAEQKLKFSNADLKSKLHLFLSERRDLIASNQIVNGKKPTLMYASSTEIPLAESSIDVVVTSPPYCTRIDYGIATLGELSVFLGYNASEVNRIRRNLTGRTTIDKKLNASLLDLDIGNEGLNFLNKVKHHESYASKSYYFKNLYQYFYDMDLSFREISRVMKYGGIFICVVQDSFYKDVHCDLPKIITEMAKISGFSLESKHSFDVAANLANLNKGSKKYRSDTKAYEAVLVFKKV